MPTPKEKIGHGFTAVVFARNEHERLPIVLRNLSNLVNVLVVDNFSTDDTVEIAKSFGRDVIQVSNVGGFVETPAVLDPVWDHLETDYILICACAELLPLTLLEYYEKVSLTRSYDVVRVDRISITAGLPIPIDLPPKWLRWHYPGEVRFFSKGSVDYTNNQVHGRGRITVCADRVLRAPAGSKYSLRQYRDYDSIETERRHAVYNDEIARRLVAAGKCPGLFWGIFNGLKIFIVRYFLYGGFTYGNLGFIHCYYRFQMSVSIAFRCYELKNGYSKNLISERHRIEKENFITKS